MHQAATIGAQVGAADPSLSDVQIQEATRTVLSRSGLDPNIFTIDIWPFDRSLPVYDDGNEIEGVPLLHKKMLQVAISILPDRANSLFLRYISKPCVGASMLLIRNSAIPRNVTNEGCNPGGI
jgi:hypothetical protein